MVVWQIMGSHVLVTTAGAGTAMGALAQVTEEISNLINRNYFHYLCLSPRGLRRVHVVAVGRGGRRK